MCIYILYHNELFGRNRVFKCSTFLLAPKSCQIKKNNIPITFMWTSYNKLSTSKKIDNNIYYQTY